MNLDDLKSQLNQRLEKQVSSLKTEHDLQLLLHKQATSLSSKLKKSLQFEIIFSILFFASFVYVSFTSSHFGVQMYFGIFSVICLVFLFILFYLQKRTEQLTSSTLSVKNNLTTLHTLLSDFKKRYTQFTMGLIPIAMCLSFYFGFQDGLNGVNSGFLEGLPSFKTQKAIYISLIIYSVIFSIAMYYFTKWYLNKLYGRHLTELKKLLNELEE